MKSFLLKDNKPICKWGMLPNETYYEGKIPEGYALAVAPTDNYIVLDVDVKNNKNGFNNIPEDIKSILDTTFYYDTKSGGRHYWLEYTGSTKLLNKSTLLGLDLRVATSEKSLGYVRYYHDKDIRECRNLIIKTPNILNAWLVSLFSNINTIKI